LTNFSKNSFYLLPEPLRLGEFLTNYYNIKFALAISLTKILCIFTPHLINVQNEF